MYNWLYLGDVIIGNFYFLPFLMFCIAHIFHNNNIFYF